MSKDLGSQYGEAVSQGDFTRLHDLFWEDIVFLDAAQGDSCQLLPVSVGTGVSIYIGSVFAAYRKILGVRYCYPGK